jgi:hypothetical protein
MGVIVLQTSDEREKDLGYTSNPRGAIHSHFFCRSAYVRTLWSPLQICFTFNFNVITMMIVAIICTGRGWDHP